MVVGGHFWDLLRPHGREEGPDFLRGKRVAVDLSFWIVQHDAAIRTRLPSARNTHLRFAFFRTLSLFSKMGALPVFVEDGDPSPLKFRARMERFYRGSGMEIPDSVVDGLEGTPAKPRNRTFLRYVRDCVELLELMGIPVVRANGEAEALCAQLNHEGHVDACITADSDAFIYGAKCVVKSFHSNRKAAFECYYLSDIQAALGLCRKQMIAVALLAGNDHDLDGVPGFGVETAVRFVKLFSEDEVLIRLCEVGKGIVPLLEGGMGNSGDFYSPGEGSSPSKTRHLHCSRCGHPGSKRVHSRSGCDDCVSSGFENCEEKLPGFRCSCSFCDKERVTKERRKQDAWQIKACKKIATGKNFPNNNIIDMFMNNNHGKLDDLSLAWRNPAVDTLIDFLAHHQGWEPSFTRQKLLPMLSTIYLRDKASAPDEGLLLCDQYEFDSVQRVKMRFGCSYYVVKWRRIPDILSNATSGTFDAPIETPGKDSTEIDLANGLEEDAESPQIVIDDGRWFLLTDEDPKLVQAAFPEQVHVFLEKKRAEESSKKKKRTTGSGSPPRSSGIQLSITEFYRATKVLCGGDERELRKAPCDNNHPAEARNSVVCTDRNIPKSVRRRLLFG